MYKSPDIRYEATAPATSAIEYGIFPIYIAVTQATSAKALEDARKITEEFDRFMQKISIAGARFQQCSLEQTYDSWASKLTIQQSSRHEVKLILGYCGLLMLEENTDFWARASAITVCTDSIQEFCSRSRVKHIEVSVDSPRIQTRRSITSQSAIDDYHAE
jgi:hypothetical protein